MTEQSLINLIGSLGFPIAVTVYLLVYMRKSLDSLKEVITKNTEMMAKVCDKLNAKEKQ